MFKRFQKLSLIILSLILGIGTFLRVYDISTNYYFSGELGKEMLYIRQFALAGKLPLVGMATSHPWLLYGPFYYWIMIPIFSFFSGNPFILFWTAAAVSVVGLALNYFVVSKIADKKLGLISASLEAISPLLVWQTRLSKLHVFFFILTPLFMYLLYLLWNGKKRWLFWAGLLFGLMFSFHFSQIPLLGVVVLLFWLKKDIYGAGDWLKLAIGIVIPNLTLIWYDRSLALWLPYRTANIAEKNPGGTLNSLTEYFGRTLFSSQNLWTLGLIVFAFVFVHYIWVNRKRFKTDFLSFYLISSVSLMVLANVVHGAPPVHYFLPIFVTVPLLYSIYLSKLKWGILLLIVMFAVNFGSYFAKFSADDYIPYSKQVAATSFIVSDAGDRDFSIKRIGPYDYFPKQYSQAYKYLILWQGGNLVENSPNAYTIIEKNGEVYVQK